MKRLISYIDFWFMALTYKIRDYLYPREKVLEEANIKEGFRVLDFGCGPGSYIYPLSKLVGESGKIYALDIHPLAIKMINKLAEHKHIGNVSVILSERKTELPDNCLDIVLLYDIFHALENTESILREIHRALKPEGILSFSDHHLSHAEITSEITRGKLFKLLDAGKKTYSFKPENIESKSTVSLFGNALSVL